MQNSIFFVDSEPYCIWDENLTDRNNEFLRGLDPDYFDYAYKAHLDPRDTKRASLALRLSLHHASETFFSLISALVQAPDCPYAWLSKCSTSALRSVVRRISSGDQSLFSKLNLPTLSWEGISRAIFVNFQPATKDQEDAIQGFANLWARQAAEFQDTNHIDEYNSLKHGFRVGNGGFSLSFAPSPADGSSVADEHFTNIGRSDFGSRYFKIRPLSQTAGERSLTLAQHSNNWSFEKVALLNQLTYLSINNVVTALRVILGHSDIECRFLRPTDNADYLRPWEFSTGVTSMQWASRVSVSAARSLTKKEIVELLNAQ